MLNQLVWSPLLLETAVWTAAARALHGGALGLNQGGHYWLKAHQVRPTLVHADDKDEHDTGW